MFFLCRQRAALPCSIVPVVDYWYSILVVHELVRVYLLHYPGSRCLRTSAALSLGTHSRSIKNRHSQRCISWQLRTNNTIIELAAAHVDSELEQESHPNISLPPWIYCREEGYVFQVQAQNSALQRSRRQTIMKRRDIITLLLTLLSLWPAKAVTRTAKAMTPDEQAARDKETYAKFLKVCQEGSHIDSVVDLLKKMPDEALQNRGTACLIVAMDQPEMIEAVCNVGVNPSPKTKVQDKDGEVEMTPLSWHVLQGYLESTEALLRKGADPNVRFPGWVDGEDEMITVFDIVVNQLAEKKGGSQNKELLDYRTLYAMRSLLLEYGAKSHFLLENEKSEL